MTPENRDRLRARLERAIQNLYHAATPAWPRDFGPFESDFFDWVADAARFEIEYLSDGGPYGRDYRSTLAATCNAGRYSTDAARAYYIRKEMREMRRDFDANPYLQTVDMFGRLYTYGRGGRTLAPADLVRTRGGSSFSMNESVGEEWNAARLTDAIRVVESFGDYVTKWNAGIPEMWTEETQRRATDFVDFARADMGSARLQLRALVADGRAMRAAGVETPTVCDTVAREVAALRRTIHESMRDIRRLRPFAV